MVVSAPPWRVAKARASRGPPERGEGSSPLREGAEAQRTDTPGRGALG